MASDNHAIRRTRMAAARALATHTREEWERMKVFCAHRCVRCGFQRGDLYVEKDHIKPVYQGGSDGIDNLQPLCARCNVSKGPEGADHRPEGWREFVVVANP